MKRRAITYLMLVLGCIALYCAAFSYLWLRNPAYIGTSASGKQCRYVDFKYDKFTAQTAILWRPGLRFMEHVAGYEDTGELAAFENTVIYYAKPN